ncbi:MAG: decaprenyl-phosphate phosphoribosyltransferase [Anaerolineales bacterium]|nr:decaprenyl-phosphate phosphoribosyltransferase [Anaerolineales bacterium]
MRPRQWPKNAFVFAGIVFDGTLENLAGRVANTVLAFILLCFMSSAVYLMNDLADIESDRLHPTKKNRPLPSGKLSTRTARIASIIFSVGSLAAGFALSFNFGLILLAYLLIQIAYTFYLKHLVLLDVMAVSSGFILRVAAGVTVIEVQRFSPWLYVCTGLGALFLALGKRRHELVLLGQGAGSHRAILEEYTLEFVDRLLTLVSTSALVAYAMYTFLSEGLPQNHVMMWTIPIVVYMLFRLLYLMMVKGDGGAPEELLLKDRPLQIALLFWCITVVIALYVLS